LRRRNFPIFRFSLVFETRPNGSFNGSPPVPEEFSGNPKLEVRPLPPLAPLGFGKNEFWELIGVEPNMLLGCAGKVFANALEGGGEKLNPVPAERNPGG